MKIYVAAPWDFRPEAAQFAAQLTSLGHLITCAWWEHADTKDGNALRTQADVDLQGVANCDLLILLQLAKSEGKSVEMGYAMAHRKPVLAVVPTGQASNIFHYSPKVFRVSSIAAALDAVAAFRYWWSI